MSKEIEKFNKERQQQIYDENIRQAEKENVNFVPSPLSNKEIEIAIKEYFIGGFWTNNLRVVSAMTNFLCLTDGIYTYHVFYEHSPKIDISNKDGWI